MLCWPVKARIARVCRVVVVVVVGGADSCSIKCVQLFGVRWGEICYINLRLAMLLMLLVLQERIALLHSCCIVIRCNIVQLHGATRIETAVRIVRYKTDVREAFITYV